MWMPCVAFMAKYPIEMQTEGFFAWELYVSTKKNACTISWCHHLDMDIAQHHQKLETNEPQKKNVQLICISAKTVIFTFVVVT